VNERVGERRRKIRGIMGRGDGK